MHDVPFDAVGSLLLFLIGVPALVIQSIAPEVRNVIFKRWRRLLLETGLPVAVALSVFIAGLMRHMFWDDQAAIHLGGNLVVPLPDGGSWTWTIVLLVMIATATYTAMRIPYRYGRREQIIQSLQRETFRDGVLVESSLEELIALGRQSEAGEDKELVLSALYNLARQMYAVPGYKGDRLETLILGLTHILTSSSQPGNGQNFDTAAQILLHITKSAKLPAADVLAAIHTLGELGQGVLLHVGPLNLRPTAMKYVQALGSTVNRHPDNATDVSQALFEIGVVAVRQGQMLIAMASMSDLLTLAQFRRSPRGRRAGDGQAQVLPEELSSDVLGLIAHFWVAGATAREYAETKLREVGGLLHQPLEDALEAARQHCARTTKFQVADNLTKLIEDLRQASPSYRHSLIAHHS
ncbi:MAG TPA: hypothetical protein VFX76_00845 [Roseiflexaceae bacterium]|nr:hypothetical protein [Roseiflexaceae bacterium]